MIRIISMICIILSYIYIYNIHLEQLLIGKRSETIQQQLDDAPSSYQFTTTNNNNTKLATDYEIVTTNYGWKSSNPLDYSQRKITQEFFNAVTSHPKYNASANWDELETNPNPNRRLIIFLDIDTCIENNYPEYGKSFLSNMAINVTNEDWYTILEKSCSYIQKAANSPALLANPNNRLVLLDCGNAPWYRIYDVCGDKNVKDYRTKVTDNLSNQVIIANYGITQDAARPIDIGLPPPAIKSIELSPYERHYIQTCKTNRRYYLFSFQGRGGFRRDRLKLLDNGEDVYVKIRESQTYWGKISNEDVWNYGEVMRNSLFAAAPRGDCLYSYRFAEIMSAGVIPVVYADQWLPPFSSPSDPNRVIDWSKCGLFIPEYKLRHTVDMLRDMTDELICEMQKCSLAFWDEFASSREGWLRGILRWVNREPEIIRSELS